MKSSVIIIICTFFLTACDPHYCGIKVINLSPKDVYIIQESDTVLAVNKNYKSLSHLKIINRDTIWDDHSYDFVKIGDSLLDCPPGVEGYYYKHLKKKYTNNSVKFFIIDKEIFRHQSWDSIVEKKLYEKVLSYSIDSLKKLNWRIAYKGPTLK